MMKRIRTPLGVAAAALAASALLAAPATAQDRGRGNGNGPRGDRTAEIVTEAVVGEFLDGGVKVRVDFGNNRGYRDDWRRNGERDARRAVQDCRAAITSEGYRRGFRDIDFDGRRVRQTGPAGYVVTFDTEFEGRRREFDTLVRCEVRRGRVVDLDGIPQAPRGGKAYGYYGGNGNGYGRRW